MSLRKRHRLVFARASCVHARVCELAEAGGFLLGASVDVAYEHAEALSAVSIRGRENRIHVPIVVLFVVQVGNETTHRLERRDLASLRCIVQGILHVVHRHATTS
jgi:hypothetical protein